MKLGKTSNINLVIPTYKRYKKASKLIDSIILFLPNNNYPNIVISISENGSNKLEKYKYFDKRIRYSYSKKVLSMSENIANALKNINIGYLWIIPDDDFIQESEFRRSIDLMSKLDNDLLTFTFCPKSNIQIRRKINKNFIYESLNNFDIPFTLLSSIAINIRSDQIIKKCIRKLQISDNTFAQNYILLEILEKVITVKVSDAIPFVYNDKPHSRWSGAKGVLDSIEILCLYFDKLDLKFNNHLALKKIFINNLLDNVRISLITDSYERSFTESELEKYHLLTKSYLTLKKYIQFTFLIKQIYKLRIDFIFKYLFRFLRILRNFFFKSIKR